MGNLHDEHRCRNLFILALLVIDLGLVALYLFGGWIAASGWLFTRFFDLDDDMSLPTWYSSAQFFAIAGVWAMVALGAWRRRDAGWLPTVMLGGLFALMSIDEVSMIHEHLGYVLDAMVDPGGERANTAFAQTGVWFIFLGPPALVVLLVLAWRTARSFGRRSAMIFAAGVVLFIATAVGLEGLSNFLPPRPLWHFLEVSFEEGGEMVSATIMLLGAALAYEQVYGPLALPSPLNRTRAGAKAPVGPRRPASSH